MVGKLKRRDDVEHVCADLPGKILKLAHVCVRRVYVNELVCIYTYI